MDTKKLESLALLEAQKSLCKKRKVGAIIVDKDGTVLSTGYNYLPNNTGDFNCEDEVGNTKPTVIHAEAAAFLNLTQDGLNTAHTIFVTHKPCQNCQALIDEANLNVHLVTTFMKFDTGKLQYSLVPPVAIKALAQVLTYGAKKYKPNNWQMAEDTSRYVNALYRHLEAWRAGEVLDSESGLPHLAHAIANIAFLIHFETSK